MDDDIEELTVMTGAELLEKISEVCNEKVLLDVFNFLVKKEAKNDE